MGKVGRRDPHEEFGFGAAKKRRASPVLTEEVVEDVDDSDILFKPDTDTYKFLFPLLKQMKITNALLKVLLKENNKLLTGLIQGGMGVAVGNQQELSDPELKRLLDGVTAMTPHPQHVKFYKLFVQNYTKLLHFKKQFNSVKVTPHHDPQLGNWLKNMKTQLVTCYREWATLLWIPGM